jgi:hypothetical protein
MATDPNDTGAAGAVQDTAENLAHNAVDLAGSVADVPREAAAGILSAVSRTLRSLGDAVEHLERVVAGG